MAVPLEEQVRMFAVLVLLIWTLFGLIAGIVARAVTPGREAPGVLGTSSLGIVGSFLGGLLTAVLNGGRIQQPTGLFMAMLGAILLLALARGNPRNKAWS